MITAKDAIKITMEAQKQSMKVLYKSVLSSAKQGQREVRLNTILMPDFVNELKAIGYIVQVSERYGGSTQIAW